MTFAHGLLKRHGKTIIPLFHCRISINGSNSFLPSSIFVMSVPNQIFQSLDLKLIPPLAPRMIGSKMVPHDTLHFHRFGTGDAITDMGSIGRVFLLF
jgi:hypothetical protein